MSSGSGKERSSEDNTQLQLGFEGAGACCGGLTELGEQNEQGLHVRGNED